MVTSECHCYSDSTDVLGDTLFKRLAVSDILFSKKVVREGGIKEGGNHKEYGKTPNSHGMFWDYLDLISIQKGRMGSSLDSCNLELQVTCKAILWHGNE